MDRLYHQAIETMGQAFDAFSRKVGKLWCYEKEWRIIEHEHGAGTYSFPPELLTGVIIGCQMPDENKNKIINWVRNRNSKPILYKAEVMEGEFGLDIEKLG